MDMTPSQKTYVLTMLIFAALVLLAGSVYVHYVRSNYIHATQALINSDRTALVTLETLIGHNSSDAQVDKLIKDCKPESRTQFDTLLGQLSQLHGKDLTTIDQLFNQCSSFYAVQQGVMVLKLEREYQAYKDSVNLLILADKRNAVNTYAVSAWGTLVDNEQKRVDLTVQLVDLQGQIIQALLKNVSVTSKEMQALLGQAQEVRGTLSLLSTQVDQQRKEILQP